MANIWINTTDQTYQWADPATGAVVKFRAKLIIPLDHEFHVPDKVPLAVYFHSMGEKIDSVLGMAKDWQKIAQEPFLLVCPAKPHNGWWFIDSDSEWGWVQGSVCQGTVQLYCRWLKSLADTSGSDAKRIGLFGWSGGAYAVTEILAQGCIPLSGVGLGAVHGHGQKDDTGLPPHLAEGAVEKFDLFLKRLKRHKGCPWIEGTHATEDQESKWGDAEEIFKALSHRQQALRKPCVNVRELAPEDQDVRPKKKKNKTHHNYFNASFLREDFLVALLGGAKPNYALWHKKRQERAAEEASWNEEPAAKQMKIAAGWGSSTLGIAAGSSWSNDNSQADSDSWSWEQAAPANDIWSQLAQVLQAQTAQADMACWDMQTKGFCPRGKKCKYCAADAAAGY